MTSLLGERTRNGGALPTDVVYTQHTVLVLQVTLSEGRNSSTKRLVLFWSVTINKRKRESVLIWKVVRLVCQDISQADAYWHAKCKSVSESLERVIGNIRSCTHEVILPHAVSLYHIIITFASINLPKGTQLVTFVLRIRCFCSKFVCSSNVFYLSRRTEKRYIQLLLQVSVVVIKSTLKIHLRFGKTLPDTAYC